MNRDDIIRKFIKKNNAIPQDLDKMTDDELMELLDTHEEFTEGEHDLFDDFVDSDF